MGVATIARLVGSATRIVVVAGAGISVSAGLPDFRSPNGLYAALGATVADPAAVFHIDAFREDPAPFFAAAARLVAPESAVLPTATHAFFRELDDSDGSGGASDGDAVGVMKPDIVLFGEPLPPAVATCVAADVRPGAADLVLVVGTSLAVAPVSTLPARFPAGVPRVLLNRTPVVPPGGAFDYVALGDCDAIVGALRRELGARCWVIGRNGMAGGWGWGHGDVWRAGSIAVPDGVR
ncbi:hypothetical protein I4F81_009342 [Pyropia yezoensis]|uniref:Uncharacterized protein n=1 Tax=Pyropia yezoensis TaxID=2788 RepID=A0ACC3C9N4_PYRYE|nr:hypothetical protein I4F81_009342 [Neopyropia yezoensis]